MSDKFAGEQAAMREKQEALAELERAEREGGPEERQTLFAERRQQPPGRVRRYWQRASKSQRTVLAAVFLLVLVSGIVGGLGLLIGVPVALLWTAVAALIWTLIARAVNRVRR